MIRSPSTMLTKAMLPLSSQRVGLLLALQFRVSSLFQPFTGLRVDLLFSLDSLGDIATLANFFALHLLMKILLGITIFQHHLKCDHPARKTLIFR